MALKKEKGARLTTPAAEIDEMKPMGRGITLPVEPRRGVKEACELLHLPLQIFPWTTSADRAGFTRSAVYVIRPDGYVAIADEGAAPQKWSEYFTRRGINLDSTA